MNEKLFELILWTDTTTVGLMKYVRDGTMPEDEYQKIRSKHYENQRWIQENGLQEQYYDYMFEHFIKPSLEEQNHAKD